MKQLLSKLRQTKGFTLIEMLLVLLIISVLLILIIPNIAKQSDHIQKTGCKAQMRLVDSQIEAYTLKFNQKPNSIDDLIREGYLKDVQKTCKSGEQFVFKMARPLHHKNVFTLVEMLIVMCVISITLYLFMTIKSSMYSPQNIKDQIKLLTSKIDYYQAYAIKHRQTVLMVFRPNKNNIRVVFQNGQKDIVIPLSPLHLDEGSTLNTIAFDKDGNILKFGKLKFQYMQYHFDLIFHIEQGRYRIVSNE